MSILPHYFCIRDYQYFVVYFLIDYFIGDGFLLISKVEMRHLMLSQPKAVSNYFHAVEQAFKYYNIITKFHKLENKENKISN